MDVESLAKQKKQTENDLDYIKSKLLSKSQLKSNIPKPVPYVRRTREPRSKSCSLSCFNKTAPPLCNPETNLNLNKKMFSQNSKQTEKKSQTLSYRSQSVKTTNSSKNLYHNVRAKIDNKTPTSLLLKSLVRHPRVSLKQSNHLDLSGKFRKMNSLIEVPPGDQVLQGKFTSDEMQGEKKECLTTHSKASDLQPHDNLQDSEANVGTMEEKDIFEHMEGCKGYILEECAPEFMSSFEKQMEKVSQLWLELIRDMITIKMTIGKNASTKLFLHNPTLSLRDEITKFFEILPTQGELLHNKLCNIEEEQLKTLRVVIQNIIEFTKEHEELRQKNYQLEKPYKQTNSQLKEELAILDQENKELDMKYSKVIDKYEIEKSKAMEHQQQQIEIMKEVIELREIVRHVEGKYKELESRKEKIETNRLTLEKSIRNIEKTHEKDNIMYENLLKRHVESENVIRKMELALEEKEFSRTSMEEKSKELQDKLTDLKATCKDSLQKRAELEKEICCKTEKIKELEVELDFLRTNNSEHYGSKILTSSPGENGLKLVTDLVHDNEKKDSQIQELKKRINRLEHMLKEKSTREEKLLAQVSKFSKKCSAKSTYLNNEIKEQQDTVKSLNSQILELEKVLGQKALELDQRDRMIKELKELIQLRNENSAIMCDNNKYDTEKYKKKLMNIEEEHCITQNQIEKRFSYCHKKMIEMFSLLERKQMKIMKLERRICGLQKFQAEKGRLGVEHKQTKIVGPV